MSCILEEMQKKRLGNSDMDLTPVGVENTDVGILRLVVAVTRDEALAGALRFLAGTGDEGDPIVSWSRGHFAPARHADG